MKTICLVAIIFLNTLSGMDFKETRHMSAFDVDNQFLGQIELN